MDPGSLTSPDERKMNKSVADLEKKEPDLESSAPASGSGRKSGGSKETMHSLLNFVNKSTTQFKKPQHRRTASSVNWFPRKKTDSFLKRKIRHLQEMGGMNLSLDETLGNASPHYTRIAREKIAAQEAAKKAMEARKAALVEASWCRILRAARLCTKVAEAELKKAEQCAAEAFEAARAMGVMMYDRPDCPRQTCEIETSSANGGRSTHTVTTSFETAFEVDKEVAAAVKRAFIQHANNPSCSNKEEFKDMLRKFSENPDTNDVGEDLLRTSSECGTDPGSELDKVLISNGDAVENEEKGLKPRKQENDVLKTDDNSTTSISSTELLDKMLDRLKGLHEDELSSLAVIVATCGLNAALLEVQHSKEPDGYSNSSHIMDDNIEKEPLTEIPSLDKFLVKHVTRLEKEVQEARNSKKNNSAVDNHETPGIPIRSRLSNIKTPTTNFTSDLGSVLVKHLSRLEREVLEARKLKNSNQENQETTAMSDMQVAQSRLSDNKAAPSEFTSDLGSVLVKHVSRLEKEVQEARNSNKSTVGVSEMQAARSCLSHKKAAPLEFTSDLGSVLVKHVSKLEREIQETRKKNRSREPNVERRDINSRSAKSTDVASPSDHILVLERKETVSTEFFHEKDQEKLSSRESIQDTRQSDSVAVCQKIQSSSSIGAQQDKENLDSNIVNVNEMHQVIKHMSRIERARLEVEKAFSTHSDETLEPGGLGKILVKPLHWLEKEKMQAKWQERDHGHVDARKEAREREMQEAWGGLSLGNCTRPHLSRLERDKAAWRKAEEEERSRTKAL